MADSSTLLQSDSDVMTTRSPILVDDNPCKPHSTVPEKTPKKRGRKRKSEKATSAEDTSGPPPVKRGRGRPPRSAQTNSGINGGASLDEDGEGANAARERSRVKTLRDAFLELQRSLPSVPPDTKLSKLDVLVLATTYISHLMKTLDDGDVMDPSESKLSEKQHRLNTNGLLHPVKKWPMRSRLYAGSGGFPVSPGFDTISSSSTSV